jgi:methyl-accepting chemotaxis protein
VPVSRLKVSGRVYLGFSIPIALALLVTGYGVMQFSAVREHNRTAEALAGNMQRVLEMSHLLETVRRAETHYRLDSDDVSLKERDQAGSRIKALLAESEAAGPSADQHQLLDELLAALRVHGESFGRLVTLTDAITAANKLLDAGGREVAVGTAELIKATRDSQDPAALALAGQVDRLLLVARVTNWRFQALYDPKGPGAFKKDQDKAQIALSGLTSAENIDIKTPAQALAKAFDSYAGNFRVMADATLASIALDETELVPQIVAMQKRLAGVEDSLVAQFELSSTNNASMIDRASLLQQALAGILLVVGVALATIIGRGIARPIIRMTDAMARLAAGEKTIEIPARGRGDEIGAMARAVQVFKENALHAEALEREQAAALVTRAAEDVRVRSETQEAAAAAAATLVVGSIGAGLSRLAAGDLTYRLNTALPPAYEQLRSDLNDAMSQLQSVVQGIVVNTGALRSGTGEIAQAADNLSQRTEQQAASLEQTAAALDEITATVSKTADGAKLAGVVVARARSDAEHSGQVVLQAVAAMGEIEASSRKVGQIIGVIDEIAFQTNLLALNAGIEAARVGDAGRGFAVVASEVRVLAHRSATAAREIKALVSDSAKQVGVGVALVDETGQALARIVAQVTEVDVVVREIAASASEQAIGLHEVNTAINQMDQATQQNAAMVEQSTAASHALARETEQLAQLTGRFQLGEPGREAAPRRRAMQLAG